ncbi:MAG: tRNA lysidine(34) synthetase TilS [Deltaproteobacteria bacterium]|nr:MAG: tRNA lysidine(34) synthetase TilS [Deltaproteobacteria bacterium]
MTAISRLRDRVGQAIAEHGLWEPGQRVAVAVSGGLDSIALLDLLLRTRGLHRGVLSVVTVDHGQHAESSEHARFVLDVAQSWGVEARLVSLDLPSGSSERVCREARYEAFGALGVDRVALAHHRDDQSETVLLALIRGSGAAGRAGMAFRRGRYVRPLLDVPRADLQAWVSWRSLEYVTDPTNADPRFLRNRLRLEVLPALEAARPGSRRALARAASHARDDEVFLQRCLDTCKAAALDEGGLSAAWVSSGPPALVRRALQRLGPELGSAHIDAIIRLARSGGGRLDLPGGGQVRIQDQKLHLVWSCTD